VVLGTFFYRKAMLCCSPVWPRFQTSKNTLEALKIAGSASTRKPLKRLRREN